MMIGNKNSKQTHERDNSNSTIYIKKNKDQTQRKNHTSHLKKKRTETIKISQHNIEAKRIRHSPILHQSKDLSLEESMLTITKERQNYHNKIINKRSSNHLHNNDQQKHSKHDSIEKLNSFRVNKISSKKRIKEMSFRYNSTKNTNRGGYAQSSSKRKHNLRHDDDIGQIFNSFVCKSIDPLRMTPNPLGEKNQIINHEDNYWKVKANKEHENNIFLIKNNDLVIKRISQSAVGNEFHTKIKKKCLEKNPHLLASIIKKKNETLNKEELYKYVNRLISKVDHKN